MWQSHESLPIFIPSNIHFKELRVVVFFFFWMIKGAKYAYCLCYTERGGGAGFRRTFLITTIVRWDVSPNIGDSNARVTAADINGTSGAADSVRRYAHAPKVTGTKYIFVRQDVCVWKRDSSVQHVFLPVWLLIFSPGRARAALKAVRWLKKTQKTSIG